MNNSKINHRGYESHKKFILILLNQSSFPFNCSYLGQFKSRTLKILAHSDDKPNLKQNKLNSVIKVLNNCKRIENAF